MHHSSSLAFGLALAMLGLACGPPSASDGESGGSGTSGTSGSGESELGESGTEEESGESGTEEESGETDTATETDTGGDPDACSGGIWLGIEWGSLGPITDAPPSEAEEAFWGWGFISHSFECTVVELSSDEDAYTARLSCSNPELDKDFEWVVPHTFELLDDSWLDRPLSLLVSGNYNFFNDFYGWYVIRGEEGLLWVSGEPGRPPADATAPLSIELDDQGETCVLFDDPCFPEFGHPLVFDSPIDGELRVYGGNGHQTPDFTYLGEVITYEDYASPFSDECDELYDNFVGTWVELRVVRRL